MKERRVLAAYSRLRFLLEERSLTRAQLRRSIAEREPAISARTLDRLADPDQPLGRIDLRAAGAVCRELGIGLGDLIVFARADTAALRSLPDDSQQRMDQLMTANNEGQLTDAELTELEELVAEAEAIARSNARRLVDHRRRLRTAATSPQRATAG